MTRNKKHQQIASQSMPNNKDKEVKQIKDLKVKYLTLKENQYGTNHFFAIIDETPLKEMIELGETMDMKMPFWEYNENII